VRSIRSPNTICVDQDLVSHLEQRRIALLDPLDRSIATAHLDHPHIEVLLNEEARLGDGRNMGVERSERRLATQRPLYVGRRRRLL
jgi:hypothetical protein